MTKGNLTDQGILKYLISTNSKVDELFAKKESLLEFNIPFNSNRKRATTAIKNPRLHNNISVFSKGAPEIVIDDCENILNEHGEIIELTQAMK